MTTKKEREADEQTEQARLDSIQAEQDRQTHLVDPMTHPSSGDPPPAMTPNGDRLGAIPVTRNAVADQEQAKQEGLQAAEQGEPTKAEKASGHKAEHKAEKKTQTPSKDSGGQKSSDDTRTKTPAQDTPDDTPDTSPPSWNPFAAPTEAETFKK